MKKAIIEVVTIPYRNGVIPFKCEHTHVQYVQDDNEYYSHEVNEWFMFSSVIHEWIPIPVLDRDRVDMIIDYGLESVNPKAWIDLIKRHGGTLNDAIIVNVHRPNNSEVV